MTKFQGKIKLFISKNYPHLFLFLQDIKRNLIGCNNKDEYLASIAKKFKNKKGIEIAGPSWIFYQCFPIYKYSNRVDNVNREITNPHNNADYINGEIYRYYFNKKGKSYTADASNLGFEDSSYDFLVSRAVIEHIANPIKAIQEWRRVIKEDGFIVVSAPDKRYTYDYLRRTTEFSHLIDDFENNVDEHDKTHFKEVTDLLHDQNMPEYKSLNGLADKYTSNNFQDRHTHHHVFSLDLLCKLISYSGFRVIYSSDRIPGELLVIAEKISDELYNMTPNTKIVKKYC